MAIVSWVRGKTTNASKSNTQVIISFAINSFAERYEFPTGVYLDRSSLTTTVTDSRTDNCRDSIAYIADLNGYGLVVFDLSQRTSWRVNHNYFFPNPLNGFFTIAGASFDLMDGIFGMALGK